MSSNIHNPRLHYLEAKEAGRLVGYSSDYVTRLAREKKVLGVFQNRQWYVDPEALKYFSLQAAKEKQNRRQELRSERLRERAKTVVKITKKEESYVARTVKETRLHAMLETAVVVCCFVFLIGIVSVGYREDLSTKHIALGLENMTNMLAEEVVFDSGDVLSQAASLSFIHLAPKEKEPETASLDQLEDGTFIFTFDKESSENWLQGIRNPFSDEVDVLFDGPSSGYIIPVFRKKSEHSYRFLINPTD